MSVEEVNAAKTTFEKLMGCLKTSSASVCNQPLTRAPTPGIGFGRRLFAGSHAVGGGCNHGATRCDKGSTLKFPSSAMYLAGGSYRTTRLLASNDGNNGMVTESCASISASTTGTFRVFCGKDGKLTADDSACRLSWLGATLAHRTCLPTTRAAARAQAVLCTRAELLRLEKSGRHRELH